MQLCHPHVLGRGGLFDLVIVRPTPHSPPHSPPHLSTDFFLIIGPQTNLQPIPMVASGPSQMLAGFQASYQDVYVREFGKAIQASPPEIGSEPFHLGNLAGTGNTLETEGGFDDAQYGIPTTKFLNLLTPHECPCIPAPKIFKVYQG